MDDYGPLEFHKIVNAYDFWSLYDELLDDNSNFINNRNSILEAYNDGRLFGLSIQETDSMFNRGAQKDKIFCKNNTFYLIPCFAITNKLGDKISIIWVHSRARRNSYGKKMVEFISKINNKVIPDSPLAESTPFWKACGFHINSS